MKKTLLASLCLAALSSSGTLMAADFIVDGIYYNIISLARKTCEVTKKGGELQYSGNIVVPATVVDPADGEQYDVVAIGESAFFYSPEMTSVSLPNSIIEIKKNAFCTSGITSIEIPTSVTTIGESAFYGTDCTSFTIPGNVKTIGDRAFYLNHQLTSITLEEGVEMIGPKSIGSNKLLTEINLPSSLTEIGEKAFSDNIALTDFTIPSGVVTMGPGVFSGCTSLVNINVAPGNLTYGSVDGVLFDAGCLTLMEYPAGRTASNYDVPEGTVAINGSVFENNTTLKSVSFPSTLRTIGAKCFNKASNLESVTFAEGLEEVGEFAFDNTPKITAFDFPTSLKRVANMSFAHHTALQEINLPGIEQLGDYAFFGAEKATSVTIGPRVTNLALVVFQRCYKVATVNVHAIVPPTCQGSSYNPSAPQFQDEVYKSATLHVPAGSAAAYAEANGWKQFLSIVDDLEVPEDPEIAVESITITGNDGVPSEIQFTNTTLPLNAVIMPEDATEQSVTWNSGNIEVATVSAVGIVEFLAPGEVTITAVSVSNPEVSASMTFIVQEPVELVFAITPAEGIVEEISAISILPQQYVAFEPVQENGLAVTLVSETETILSLDAEALGQYALTIDTPDGEGTQLIGYQITGLDITEPGTYTLTVPDGMFRYMYGAREVTTAGLSATWTIETSSADALKANSEQVEYFDLQGRPLPSATSGVVIIRKGGTTAKTVLR